MRADARTPANRIAETSQLVACRGENLSVSIGRNFRKFFSKSHRISFCVLHSPKSTRRTTLRLPDIPETSENAFKRVPGAKKRKSRKGPVFPPGEMPARRQ